MKGWSLFPPGSPKKSDPPRSLATFLGWCNCHLRLFLVLILGVVLGTGSTGKWKSDRFYGDHIWCRANAKYLVYCRKTWRCGLPSGGTSEDSEKANLWELKAYCWSILFLIVQMCVFIGELSNKKARFKVQDAWVLLMHFSKISLGFGILLGIPRFIDTTNPRGCNKRAK